MIYLDNAATTAVFDDAVCAAETAMREQYFNPNATYRPGVSAKQTLETNRQIIAKLAGAQPGEIFFTSCATESNNWVFECGRKSKGNVVITAGEHASVYEPAMRLKSRGVDVRVIPLAKDGTVDIERFKASVDRDTSLVSFIHVNNETGAVNPVRELVSVVKSIAPRALIHSDGVQAFLKTPFRLDTSGIDYYSSSAHKIGGPKGIGFLYVRSGLKIAPLLCGGGQELGMRSGTQNTPYIAAFAKACERFKEINDIERIRELRRKISEIFSNNGCRTVGADGSGYILCVCVPDVKAEVLQNAAFDRGIVIGKGSACSGSKRGNRVLEAMGMNSADIECCIRISFFADTADEDAVTAAHTIIETARQIRSGNVR